MLVCITDVMGADTYNINLEEYYKEYYNLIMIGKGLLSTGV